MTPFLHSNPKARFRRSVYLFSSFVLATFVTQAHSQTVAVGARSLAMANAYVSVANSADAVFANPGGLGQLEGIEFNLSYQKPFGLDDVNVASIAGSFPLLGFDAGLGITTIGNSLYSEQTFTTAFGHRYGGKLSWGASLTYHRTEIKNYGGSGSLAFGSGFLFQISQALTFGVQIQNLARAKRGSERLPQTMSVGMTNSPMPDLTLSLEIYKDVRFPQEIRFGVEYRPLGKIALRAGTANQPARMAAGLGFHLKNIGFDYAFFTHNDLGLTHQVSFVAQLGK